MCVQDPRVLDAMLPYQVNYYGNPHSRTHAYGWESETAMETARKVKTHSDCTQRDRKCKTFLLKKILISELQTCHGYNSVKSDCVSSLSFSLSSR